MTERNIPQLRHGQRIIDENGVPESWFVDAWNSLVDRTGGQTTNLINGIINGEQQLSDVLLNGSSLTTSLESLNSNVEEAGAEAAAGSGGLVVTLSSNVAFDSITGAGTATTNAVTCSVTGGTGPYTFTLSKVSGSTIAYTLSGSNNETVTFSQAIAAGQILAGQYKWTVEDSTGGTPLTSGKSFSVTLSSTDFSGVYA